MLNFLGTYVIEDRKRLECKLFFIHSFKKIYFYLNFGFFISAFVC